MRSTVSAAVWWIWNSRERRRDNANAAASLRDRMMSGPPPPAPISGSERREQRRDGRSPDGRRRCLNPIDARRRNPTRWRARDCRRRCTCAVGGCAVHAVLRVHSTSRTVPRLEPQLHEAQRLPRDAAGAVGAPVPTSHERDDRPAARSPRGVHGRRSRPSAATSAHVSAGLSARDTPPGGEPGDAVGVFDGNRRRGICGPGA